MFPSDGQISEKECNCLKHVEWTLEYGSNRRCWASSLFETGNESFRFVFCSNGSGCFFLQLFRRRPCIRPPVIFARCWAGLKRWDGTYHHKTEKHEFFVENKSLSPHMELMQVTSEEIEKHDLDRNHRLTFFLQINEEKGAEPCNFGRNEEFHRGVGSIEKKLLWPYVLVEWTFTIDNISEVLSPVFVVDNQYYELSFEEMPNIYVKRVRLSLSRKGPFADRHVRYLGAVRRSDDLCEVLRCWHGQMNLRKTADFWFREASISELRSSETWKDFTVDLLFTCDESPAAGTLYFSTVSEAEEDFINSPKMDPSFFVFKVEDTAFKIHKAPILVCVPMFKLVLTNGCVDSRTGVVTIKDCKAAVFKEFLELVEIGFGRMPSAENALALYKLAYKYLLRHLKNMCSTMMAGNLSVDNFCDVLELCIVYEDADFLRLATAFLSENTIIMESVNFRDLLSRYPDAVHEVIRRVADFVEVLYHPNYLPCYHE